MRDRVGEAEVGPGGPDEPPSGGPPAPPSGVPGEQALPGQPTPKGGGRFVSFLRASWAELQRVQWPNRRQVGQATAVVLGFVIIAGSFLGLVDVIAQEIVKFII